MEVRVRSLQRLYQVDVVTVDIGKVIPKHSYKYSASCGVSNGDITYHLHVQRFDERVDFA